MIVLTAAVVKCNDIHLSIVNMVHMHSNEIHGSALYFCPARLSNNKLFWYGVSLIKEMFKVRNGHHVIKTSHSGAIKNDIISHLCTFNRKPCASV